MFACGSSVKKLEITEFSNIQRSKHSQNQLMVMLPLIDTKKILLRIEKLKQSYGVKIVNSWPLKSIGLYCVVFEVVKHQSIKNMISNISREPMVDSVQEMKIFQVLNKADKLKNSSLEHLQYGIKSLEIKKAHKIATGKNVRIAIIDSGMDINHPEYRSSIEEVRNFVEKPSQSFTSDIHGTAIAGVIAAGNSQQKGIIGVSPDARLLAFKACWQTELQWGKAFCNSFSLAKAINLAIIRNVNIINLSLGGPYDGVIDRLIQKAIEKNISVVAASGSNKNEKISFPASLPNVIAVNVEIDKNKYLDIATRNPGKKLCAPGTDVISTVPGNSYDFFSGSSLSTAFVTGSIALLLEKKPTLSPQAIYSLLEKSSTEVEQSIRKQINSCAALALLLNKKICQ